MSPVNPIVNLIREALDAWKTFISTRQQAYERKMDKRQERAIGYAEEYIKEVGELFEFIHERLEVPEEEKKTFDRIKKGLYKLRDKFNKFD
jgi:hypothetical protein